VERGEFLSIIGPSGCGKTTLLHILNGLEPPSAGHVRAPADEMAFVFQRPLLLPWRSVLDNVLFSAQCRGLDLRPARAKAEDLLRRVGLADVLDYLPHQLSEGMKQRVNLARAQLIEPRVLLMDEPFAALDVDTRAAVHRELLELWQEQDLTVVFVSHNLEEVVRLSDRVAFLSAKPSAVQHIEPVDLPRPRAADAEGQVALVRLTHAIADRFPHVGP